MDKRVNMARSTLALLALMGFAGWSCLPGILMDAEDCHEYSGDEQACAEAAGCTNANGRFVNVVDVEEREDEIVADCERTDYTTACKPDGQGAAMARHVWYRTDDNGEPISLGNDGQYDGFLAGTSAPQDEFWDDCMPMPSSRHASTDVCRCRFQSADD